MSIRPLPDEAIEKLRSSVTITSLNDTVINLVKNSLDAAATRLTLSVDYTRGSCSVEDDGHGIEPEEFLESGSLGAPHCTITIFPRLLHALMQFQAHRDILPAKAFMVVMEASYHLSQLYPFSKSPRSTMRMSRVGSSLSGTRSSSRGEPQLRRIITRELPIMARLSP